MKYTVGTRPSFQAVKAQKADKQRILVGCIPLYGLIVCGDSTVQSINCYDKVVIAP